MQEVGSGPLDALESLLAQVPVRLESEEPPEAVPLADWLPAPVDDGASREE
jgi:hypothetical protein